MTIWKKQKVAYKALAWISLALNILVMGIVLFCGTQRRDFLIGYGLMSLMELSYAYAKLRCDITLDDLSNLSIFVLYAGVVVISILMIYNVYEQLSWKATITQWVCIVAETVVVICFAFRRKLRKLFRNMFGRDNREG